MKIFNSRKNYPLIEVFCSQRLQLLYFLVQFANAEVKMTLAYIKYNVPFAVADMISPLLKTIFPDSVIAQSYASAQTKTTCILNGSLNLFSGNNVFF